MTLPERAASGDAAVLSATFFVLPYFSPVATSLLKRVNHRAKHRASLKRWRYIVLTFCWLRSPATNAPANYREGCVPTWPCGRWRPPTHSTTRTDIKPTTHTPKIDKDTRAGVCIFEPILLPWKQMWSRKNKLTKTYSWWSYGYFSHVSAVLLNSDTIDVAAAFNYEFAVD